MSKPASSGIRTTADGQSIIPSSKRADGSTRKEIKVRPGYKPPEDVETYKSRSAEGWRNKSSLVPGTEESRSNEQETDSKSKNARRREAARKKKEQESGQEVDDELGEMNNMKLQDELTENVTEATAASAVEAENAEKQKKIRNHLKKLKAVRELKAKKTAGEKLSADQLIKISKEQEIVRDLVKLEYDGPELVAEIKADKQEIQV